MITRHKVSRGGGPRWSLCPPQDLVQMVPLLFGLKFGERTITDGNFADDLANLGDSGEHLLEALQILHEEAAKVGLHIDSNKTKIMAIDPYSLTVSSPVSLDSTTGIKVIQEFT